MTKEALLDKLQKNSLVKEKDRDRASQILDAVEGVSIWEARELLEHCIGALQLLDVRYRDA